MLTPGYQESRRAAAQKYVNMRQEQTATAKHVSSHFDPTVAMVHIVTIGLIVGVIVVVHWFTGFWIDIRRDRAKMAERAAKRKKLEDKWRAIFARRR